MSVKIMAQIWELDIERQVKWVLMALGDYADDDGRNIYPSLRKLAWKTDYSLRSIQRITGWLREKGALIEIQPATNRYPAVYALNLNVFPKRNPYVPRMRRGAKMSSLNSVDNPMDKPVGNNQQQNLWGDIAVSPQRATGVTPRGDIAVSPNPSLNHPKNHHTGAGAASPAVHKVNGEGSERRVVALGPELERRVKRIMATDPERFQRLPQWARSCMPSWGERVILRTLVDFDPAGNYRDWWAWLNGMLPHINAKLIEEDSAALKAEERAFFREAT
jgi:hypothetical protein